METVLFGVLPVLAFLALATRSVLRGRRAASASASGPGPGTRGPAADTALETQAFTQDTGATPPHRQGGR